MQRFVWLPLLLSALLHPAIGNAQDVPDMPFRRNLQLRVGLVGSVGSWETDRGPVQGLAVTPFCSLGLVTVGPRIFLPMSDARLAEFGFNLFILQSS